MKTLQLLVMVGCVALVGVYASAANAEPSNGNTVTVTLYDCSGPAGTPSSFDVQKVANSDPAAHVVGSTAIFRRTVLVDLTAGFTVTWGLQNSVKPLITCSAVAPNGHLVMVTGFLTPSS